MATDGSTETARGKVERTEPTRPQQAAARRFAESKATIPHLYLEIDAELQDAQPDDTARAALVVRAAALALLEHPRLNGAYRDGRFEAYSRINVGVAIGTGQDAVIPTIFDAQGKRADAIAAELSLLSERFEAGALTSPELAGGTFTVNAVSGAAVRSYTAVISQGQAAALAAGAVTERAVVRGSEVTIKPVITLTLSCDARIVGAGEAAAFLEALRSLLEAPERLA
ncbi:MAG: 2-oxo acid dehydrogenase subunit E2 [Actinomycetota bacterium]|nr:2-oxo acid dehydrogenase subunit E2 [Actinomycetota bacterium]